MSIPKVQSSSGGSQLLKRSRAPGAIVSNACNECRKKRAKCDGNEPCSRCKAQESTECVYAVPVRHSKESLRTELESLRHGAHSREQIFAALIHSDLREDILSRLQSGYPIEAITNWLEGALSSHNISRPTISQHTGISIPAQLDIKPISRRVAAEGNEVKNSSPFAAQQSRPWNDVSESSPRQSSPYNQISHMQNSNSSSVTMNWMAKVHGRSQSRASSWTVYIKQDMSKLNELMTESQSATWTSITEDYEFVEHLLALYFCWEYPTFAPFSKEHFLGDFQNGKHRYCSPILANALFALGCRFSTLPMSRTDPSDPLSSGDHFFKEAQRLLSQEIDHHSLTTIQALGIMSIREASCGRDSESYYYAGQSSRLTIEMGLHFVSKEEDLDENLVQLVTFWGAFALDHMWSLATGSLPQFSNLRHLPPKPAIITAIDESLWMLYTDDGASTQRSYQQQSNEQSVYRCLCELSELAHISLCILPSPRCPSITRSLLDIYTQYLAWYEQIPEVLRLGINFTPAVLFTHMYYHFAIMLLFRPYIKLRIINSTVSPRDICLQATFAIQSLIRSYSQLYTLRRTPSFVPFFVLSVAMMQLAIGAASIHSNSYDPFQKSTQSTTKLDPPALDAISQCIADLDEMTSLCHFAKKASDILRHHVKKWNMGVVQAGYGLLGFQQAQAKTLGPASMYTAQMAADGTENTLFSLFPMQRQPTMVHLEDLEQAGFSML